MSDPTPIVCGTDFTEPAREVADLAASLAGALGAPLLLCHVVDRSVGTWLDDAGRARVRDLALAALDGEVARLRAAHAVAVSGSLAAGSPGAELARVAAEANARLVVVAAHGPTPSIFRLGGTAERTAQAASVPVLLVRDPAPLRAWVKGDRLAVAAMLGDDAATERAIEWLGMLRRIGACDVTALHAYFVDEATRRFGLAPRPIVDADPEIEGLLRRDLERRLAGLGGRGSLTVQPVRALGRFADHLVEHPAAAAAALIVVGNHRARGIGRLTSVAAGVVHLADASVLVVPADAPAVSAHAWPAIRRVLVATDFSGFGDAAIPHAYGLVAPRGGEVTILHVMTEPSSDATRTESTARLATLVPRPAPPGVTSQVESIWKHDAAAAIVETANRVGADAIVIASHGRTGLRRLVLGSVAAGVVERSHLPVVIVRPPRDAG